MFKKISNWFKKFGKVAVVQPLTEKEIATRDHKPWVSVLKMNVNSDDIRHGFFELDWNIFFIAELKRSGYSGENEEAIINLWFNDVCTNVANEFHVGSDMNTGSIDFKHHE